MHFIPTYSSWLNQVERFCEDRGLDSYARRSAVSWLSGRRNPQYSRSSGNRHCASATAELAVSRKYPLEKVNFEQLHLSTNTLCL
jgi:hypothetical protein